MLHAFAGATVLVSGLAACGTATTAQIVGAAVNAAMETAGLKQPSSPEERNTRQLTVTLQGGEVLNAAKTGDSLALVVQVYQLRNESSFTTLSYAQAADVEGVKRVLGEDLVSVREVTLLPGKTYQFSERVSTNAKVIGVVALFRMPAANRWKLAFDREASEASGILIGLHGCAMTVGAGRLTETYATLATRSLGGVRCN